LLLEGKYVFAFCFISDFFKKLNKKVEKFFLKKLRAKRSQWDRGIPQGHRPEDMPRKPIDFL
jgi:hypothetical protein